KRQMGRLRDFNIIDVEIENKKEIFNAINYAMANKEFRNSLKKCGKIYGDGKTAERIVKVLKNIKLDNKLFEKKMTY
ncbi:UDP-N-acetylglucosamine 2-epimerase (hydrolyzing), partial [Candidatus Parcubacteria bacterium]|nr:UDP-N-acetylglucosamine 2-epimerase (hydrolyzing) [Candidatus Parcubacteria bacterium]